MPTVEERILAIEERNRRVEAEKRWEVSTTRRASITLATYFVMVLAFSAIGASDPFTNAVIPTLGFLLSNLSLPLIKRRWLAQESGREETAAESQ